MITYKIYGMHSRDAMIKNLQTKLDINDNNVYYDDRPNGGLALYTAKKAWLSPIEEGETHRVVFPDDIDVCDNFKEICNEIIKIHPDSIISFFLWEGRENNTYLNNLTSPYIYSRFVIGMGILMPVKYIDDCFSYIKEKYDDNIADDIGIQKWAVSRQIPIISTIPSLVQHLGDNSLLDPNNPIRRTIYFDQNPKVDWSNKKISHVVPSNFDPIRKDIRKWKR